MTNPANFGTLTGRLARDPKVFTNRDNSHTVRFTIMADRNFANRNGEFLSDAIDVEAFVPESNEFDKSPYARIHQGDLVQLGITLRNNTYTKADGQTVYGMAVRVENVLFLEPRSVTEKRLAARAAKATEVKEQIKVVQPATVEQPATTEEPVKAAQPMQDLDEELLPY